MNRQGRFVVDRKLEIDSLFTHRWALHQAAEACRIFNLQQAGKGVFVI